MSTKAIKVSDLPTFDPARYLRDDDDIAAYPTKVIQEGDAGELAHVSIRSPKCAKLWACESSFRPSIKP